MSKMPSERVSPDRLRRMFNEGDFLSRMQSGELRKALHRENHLKTPERFCTRSLVDVYQDEYGEDVVHIHRLILPNGRPGGSGLPDPKRLVLNGVIYYI